MRRSRHIRFEWLVEGYSTDLYRYAAWLCGDRALAEELVQETFIHAARLLQDSKHDGAVKHWLFALLRDEYHRQYERPRAETGQFGAEDVADSGRYDNSTYTFALRRALAALAPDYSEALILQVIGGFSCNDIAAFLGISPAAAMTRIFWARKRLRDILSEGRRDGSNKVMA
jgi:RNA polymerase sigma-70 factor (ECF subfamily)